MNTFFLVLLINDEYVLASKMLVLLCAVCVNSAYCLATILSKSLKTLVECTMNMLC